MIEDAVKATSESLRKHRLSMPATSKWTVKRRSVPWKAFTKYVQRSRLGLAKGQQATLKTITSRIIRKPRPMLATSKKSLNVKRRSVPWKALTGVQRSKLGLVQQEQTNPGHNIHHHHHPQTITNQICQEISVNKPAYPASMSVSVSKTVLSSTTLHSGLPQTLAVKLTSSPKAPPSGFALDMPSLDTKAPHPDSMAVLHSSKTLLRSNCSSYSAAPRTPSILSTSPNTSPTSKSPQKSNCASSATPRVRDPLTLLPSLNLVPTSATLQKSNCASSFAATHTPSTSSNTLIMPPESNTPQKSDCASSSAVLHRHLTFSNSVNVPPTSKTPQKSNCASSFAVSYSPLTFSTSVNVPPTSVAPLKSSWDASSAISRTLPSSSTLLNVPPTSKLTGDKSAPLTASASQTSVTALGSQPISDDDMEARYYQKWISKMPQLFSNFQKTVEYITSMTTPNLAQLRKRRAKVDKKIKKLQEERKRIDAMENKARIVERFVNTLDREMSCTMHKVSECKKSLKQSSYSGKLQYSCEKDV